MHYFYGIAEPDSLLLVGSPSTPWKFQGYETYHYRTLPSAFSAPDILAWKAANTTSSDADMVAHIMAHRGYPSAFLLITRAQKAHDEMSNDWRGGSLTQLEQALLESESFHVVYANADARIFVLTTQAQEAGP